MGDSVAAWSPVLNFMTGELQTCYRHAATDPQTDAKVSGIFLRRRRKRILKFVEFCFILMPHVGGRTFTCTSGNIFSPSQTLETIPRDLKQMILVDSFNALKALLREGG